MCRGMALVGKVCPEVVDTLHGRLESLGGEVNALMGFVSLDPVPLPGRKVQRSPPPTLESH